MKDLSYNLQHFWEHYTGNIVLPETLSSDKTEFSHSFFKKRGNQACYAISRNIAEASSVLNTSYFIGVDWVVENELAIYIAPKLNAKPYESTAQSFEEIRLKQETDYIKMLFSCLKHTDVAKEVKELYEIKWNKPEIQIEQKKDLLTPLLVVQYLVLIKDIVRKGLKKSYYRVEQNLYSRVKGKVKVSDTIKRNLVKSKQLNTYCSFEVFGFDGVENRLIKKTLLFIQKYLPTYLSIGSDAYVTDLMNYINPAFDTVSHDVNLNDIKHTKSNTFYKEYEEAIQLSKLILSRFGYNISNVEKQTISTPPFWIDMSKLFELYVLGLLKDRFHNQVNYHFTHFGNELDFILKFDKYKLVIDAKYKPQYKSTKDDEDVRQVSGYARLKKVYQFLEKTYPESIDCLIIYPDQYEGFDSLKDTELLDDSIKGYYGIYKIGVKLPVIDHS